MPLENSLCKECFRGRGCGWSDRCRLGGCFESRTGCQWDLAGQRRRRLREALEAGMTARLAAGQRLAFVTFTAPDLGSSSELATAFGNLVRSLRSVGPLEYCGVIARGAKSGLLHAHLVWWSGGVYVPQARVFELWQGLVGRGGVRLEAVKSGDGVTRYVIRNVGGYVSQQGSSRRLESRSWRETSGG